MIHFLTKDQRKNKKKKNSKLIKLEEQILSILFDYRFDIFAVIVMMSVILFYFEILLKPGQIVFSDIDFPFNSKTYLDEIFGIWNVKWNTTSMLNIPRIMIVIPSYLLSKIFGDSGEIFLKTFLIQNLFTAGMSVYLLIKRLIRIYLIESFTMSRIFSIIFGSLFYALNPWVIFRIQHIYLLVGYSFFPLTILLFFKVFDHKFQSKVIKNYNPTKKKLYPQNKRDMLLLAFIISISSAAIHYFFYTLITLSTILFLIILKYLIKYRTEGKQFIILMLVDILKKIFFIGIFFIGFSFFWLVIYFGSIILHVQASQNNVNVVDTYVAFSKNSSIINVIYLTSYWWPMIDMRQLPATFYIGGAILLVLITIGSLMNFIKYHIITLVTILTVIISILCTGVYYPKISKLFLLSVQIPVIGNMFRDPNKLIGLLALCFSILLVFGIEWVINLFLKGNFSKLAIFPLILLVGISLGAYLIPMKNLYVEHFYIPVEEPEDYTTLRTYYKNKKNHYGVYMPIADDMTRPFNRVTTPYWNENEKQIPKATGDLHIYNSPILTLFQYEGNDAIISYYMRYLQYLMDQGRTNQISKNIKALGADEFIYHKEYLGHEDRQIFNQKVIELDKELKKVYSNDIFSIYNTGYSLQDRDDYFSFVNSAIQTPYGLERSELYKRFEEFNPLKTPIIYMNQQAKNSHIKENSNMEIKNREDLLLSEIDDSYYLYPFEWTNQGNPFLRWSKTYLSSTDWSWYLESQGIIDRSFSFDREKGVAVTFASKALNIEPYLRKTIKGNLVMDFNTMLRTDNFFIPDNPQLVQVNSNPFNDYNKIPTMKGELVRGDPKDIWQVAKSGKIKAKENTPYYFELVISGMDVEKLHLKVRFYDENGKEIGVQYIVSPEESSNFRTIRFIGETISPIGAKSMRLDLLSYQNEKNKSYWWIHDANIYNLSQYATTNSINGKYKSKSNGVYEVYVRNFESVKGGELELKLGNYKFDWKTKSDSVNQFKWIKLGEIYLSKGEYNVQLIGKDGLNAVNAITIVPKIEISKKMKAIKKELNQEHIIATYESNIDMNYQGNIQSKRLYPKLSFGKGLAFYNGMASSDFDVLKKGTYYFKPSIQFPYKEKGEAVFQLFKGKKLIKTYALRKRVFDKNMSGSAIEYATGNLEYNYDFLESNQPYKYESSDLIKIDLDEGTYHFEIKLDSEIQSLSDINNLNKFDPASIKVENNQVLFEDMEIRNCEKITADMMSHRIEDNQINISFDPTCSYDWYSYATQKINVQENQEILIHFDAISKNLQKRHSKVLFLDQSDKLINVTYINEVEEKDKDKWNTYEQLIRVPKGANKMLIQFLGRGDIKLESNLKIKEFMVYRYNDFILLDHLIVSKDFYGIQVDSLKTDKVKRSIGQFGLKYEFNENHDNQILNTFVSPNKNWRFSGKTNDYKLNGVTQGFNIYDKKVTANLTLLLMPLYIIGLFIFVITFISGCAIIVYEYRKNKSK